MRISIAHAGVVDTCELLRWSPNATIRDLLRNRGHNPAADATVTVDQCAGRGRSTRMSVQTLLGDAGLWEGSTLAIALADRVPTGLELPCSEMPSDGWVVSVIAGSDSEAAVALPDGATLTVGRSPRADVTVRSASASWLHCTLERAGDAVRILDAGSRNGTVHGGSRLGRDGVVVTSDQVLRVGDAVLTVAHRRESGGTALAADEQRSSLGTVPFNRPPRIRETHTVSPLSVPAPQEIPETTPLNWAAILLPLIASGALVIVLGDLRFALFALLSPVLALGSHLDQRRRRRVQIRAEEARMRAALADFRDRVATAASAESRRRLEATPDLAMVLRRAFTASTQLWQQRAVDSDFLRLYLGIATQPWVPSVESTQGTTLDDRVRAVLDQTVLPDAALAADLGNAGVIGIVGDREQAQAVARGLILQATVHSGPADLTVSVSSDERSEAAWRWAGWLPHTVVPGDLQGARWLSGTVPAGQEMLRKLARAVARGANPAHVAVIDSAELLRSQESLARSLLGSGRRAEAARDRPREVPRDELTPAQVSGIVLVRRATDLPADCTTVVSLSAAGRASVLDTRTAMRLDDVTMGSVGLSHVEAAARALARFTDPESRRADASLPREVPLSSVLAPAPLTSEGIRARWARASGLSAPIGRTGDDVCSVDLVADGPHGLVGGTTGSGKSEFLRTLVAGLAASHDPSRLNFILIDFKGGAAFAACERLPHTIGTISNLDAGLASRAVRALTAELGRRQRLFAAAGAGIENLSAYVASRPSSPMPRIVLVIDEFAILAQEFPDVLASLVSIAAVGRTLGIHLLLATQRPAGVVTEDILTNTNLRIALRVQSREDSINVIGAPEAAEISRHLPGRALIRRGADDLVSVQTALVTGKPETGDGAPVTVRSLDGFGVPIRPVATESASESGPEPGAPTELDGVIDVICRAYRESGLAPPRPVWPPPLGTCADLVSLPQLPGGTGVAANVALADEPERQRQVGAGWQIAEGNLLLIGLPGSGTSTALHSIGVVLAHAHAPEELEILCLDAGAGRLRELAPLPHTSVWAGEGDRERRLRLLRYIPEEIRRRQRDPGPWRRTVVLIDGLAALRDELDEPETLELWDGLLQAYSDGPQVGVSFAMTATRPRAVPAMLEDTTEQRWVFRLPDASAYAALGIRGAAIPVAVPGRCVDLATQRQLQIARPTEPLGDRVQDISERWNGHPALRDPVGVLPAVVTTRDIARQPELGGEPILIPVGVREDTLEPATLELYDGEHALIAGPPRSGRSSLLLGIATLLRTVAAPGIAVWGIAPPRSPFSSAPLDRTASTRAGIDELLTELVALGRSGDRVLLLVDDADRLTGSDTAFDVFLRTVPPQCHLVCAGRSAELRSRYVHWTADVRAARTGILLQPDPDLDGELLGARLPRRAPVPVTPGRGYLCAGGETVFVQTMTADRSSAAEVTNARAIR